MNQQANNPAVIAQLHTHWARIIKSEEKKANRRKAPRHNYYCDDVTVEFAHPGGGSSHSKVATHDLSSGGVSFFYAGFLHTGTKVSVKLKHRSGPEEEVKGVVSWCTHLGGLWHAIGVRFATAIFPRVFVNPKDWEQIASNEPVEPQALSGELLLIDDQEMDHALMKHMLKATRLNLTAVTDAEKALALIAKTNFSAICIDLNLGIGKSTGEQSIQRLRDAGYNKSIIAVSVDVARRREHLRTMNVHLTLVKPFDAPELLSTLATALHVRAKSDQEPLYSDLAVSADTHDLLEAYCNEAQHAAQTLRALIEKSDTEAIRHLCQTLRGNGRGYGYPALSTVAAEAVRALDASGDVAEAEAELQKLEQTCRRLSPDMKP